MAPSRKNGLSKPQTSLLHAFCACNYIHSPLTRQHKTSVFVSQLLLRAIFDTKSNIMRLPCLGLIYVTTSIYSPGNFGKCTGKIGSGAGFFLEFCSCTSFISNSIVVISFTLVKYGFPKNIRVDSSLVV